MFCNIWQFAVTIGWLLVSVAGSGCVGLCLDYGETLIGETLIDSFGQVWRYLFILLHKFTLSNNVEVL